MIGIYKITSPSGKVYIGQSVDIDRRWLEHKRLRFKCETKLKNSLVKYGIESHIFEILEECIIESLNDKEAYWQDFYNSIHKGLNCIRTKSTDVSGYLSEETKKKISESRKANPDVNAKLKGISLSEEHKLKIGLANKGKIKKEDTKRKISEARKGKCVGVDHHNYGGLLNEKSRKAFSERTKKLIGALNPQSKEVLDLQTGIFYYNIKEAILYNTNLSYKKLLGNNKNNTSLVIVEDYENNKIKNFKEKKNVRNSRKITDGIIEYESISSYARIKNISTDKVYTKIKNKEINYVKIVTT